MTGSSVFPETQKELLKECQEGTPIKFSSSSDNNEFLEQVE